MTLILVAAGGALGASARWTTRLAIERLFDSNFPIATFAANVGGSLAMGVAFSLLTGDAAGNSKLPPFLIVGFLGGYTTFSAYALDAWTLFAEGRTLEALTYAIGSAVLSIAALAAGIALARGIVS
ncbi:MAG: fluoride efflux transporter CrcB [Albidovulum sp.]|nr:fluoride efflux transporter CrcB [Albidovulum sp.]MDE0534591.1 fluoride efflux transporter CrcB [Albidovulum sp.]